MHATRFYFSRFGFPILFLLTFTSMAHADVGWSLLNFKMTTYAQSGAGPDADYSCITILHKISLFRGLHWNLAFSSQGNLAKQANGSWSYTSTYVDYIMGILPLVPEGYKWEISIATRLPDGTLRILGTAFENGVIPAEFTGYQSLNDLPNPWPLITLSRPIPSTYTCQNLKAELATQMEIGSCFCNVHCQWCDILTYNDRPQNAVGFSRAACENPGTSPAMSTMASTVCSDAGCWGKSTVTSCSNFQPDATPAPPVPDVIPPPPTPIATPNARLCEPDRGLRCNPSPHSPGAVQSCSAFFDGWTDIRTCPSGACRSDCSQKAQAEDCCI